MSPKIFSLVFNEIYRYNLYPVLPFQKNESDILLLLLQRSGNISFYNVYLSIFHLISFLAPPKINLDLLRDVITLKAGSTLRIPVEFTGCPPPFVEWYHQSRRMADDTRTTIEDRDDRTQLIITNTKREDTGVYSVTVVNEAGRHSAKVRVNITDIPGAPHGPLAMTDVGNFSINLSWYPPEDDGGTNIECYVVERKDSTYKSWTKIGSYVRGTTYTAGGLKQDVEYHFRVRAENSNGVGPPLEGTRSIMIKSPHGKDIADYFSNLLGLNLTKMSHYRGKKV